MADDPAPPDGRRPGAAGWWNWLLAIPLVGTLIPAFYNRTGPRLGGIPFFYWYQLLWIPIAVTVTLVVYRITTRPPAAAGAAPAGAAAATADPADPATGEVTGDG